MKKLLFVLSAIALVGGCVKVSAPRDLPSYVTVYPGATDVVSMSMGPMSAIAYQVAARPDDVVDYYRGKASSNGLGETTSIAPGPPDQRQTRFQDLATKRILSLVVRPRGAGSMVSLTYSKG